MMMRKLTVVFQTLYNVTCPRNEWDSYLQSTRQFKEDPAGGYELIRHVECSYNLFKQNTIRVGKAFRKRVIWNYSNQSTTDNEDIEYQTYHVETGCNRLVSEKITDYPGGVVSLKNYTYNAGSTLLYPVEISTKTSAAGTEITERFKYTQDIVLPDPATEAIRQDMANTHILNTVFEKRTKQNTSETVHQTEYKKISQNSYTNRYVVGKIKTNTGPPYQPIEDRIIFEDFDLSGNPLCVSYKDGPLIVYLWGYNNRYPIAKIENATYNEVKTALGSITPESIAAKTTPSVTDFNAINNLRDNTSLKKAMITTYTYQPLVGKTSETDPAGRTIFYEYDDFGRLKQVKDEYGNIVKENRYHYMQ